jgi:hypothetical protein
VWKPRGAESPRAKFPRCSKQAILSEYIKEKSRETHDESIKSSKLALDLSTSSFNTFVLVHIDDEEGNGRNRAVSRDLAYGFGSLLSIASTEKDVVSGELAELKGSEIAEALVSSGDEDDVKVVLGGHVCKLRERGKRSKLMIMRGTLWMSFCTQDYRRPSGEYVYS